MPGQPSLRRCALLLYTLSAAAIPCVVSRIPFSGTVPFVLDGNRTYAQVGFVRPDGTMRLVFVFVDMGSPAAAVSKELFEELHLSGKEPLRIRVQELPITVDSGNVSSESWLPFPISDDRRVEG